MKRTAVVLVFVLLCAPTALSQVPDDQLIVPGQRVGRWTLQMSIEDLERMNGPAQRTMFRAGGGGAEDSVRDFTVLTWGTLGLKVATTDGKTVDVVLIHKAPYRTEQGIGVFSSREAVLRAYGLPTAETHITTGQVRLIYDTVGLSIRVVGVYIQQLGVFRAGTAKTLWKV